jgi:hypothetical protein
MVQTGIIAGTESLRLICDLLKLAAVQQNLKILVAKIG